MKAWKRMLRGLTNSTEFWISGLSTWKKTFRKIRLNRRPWWKASKRMTKRMNRQKWMRPSLSSTQGNVGMIRMKLVTSERRRRNTRKFSWNTIFQSEAHHRLPRRTRCHRPCMSRWSRHLRKRLKKLSTSPWWQHHPLMVNARYCLKKNSSKWMQVTKACLLCRPMAWLVKMSKSKESINSRRLEPQKKMKVSPKSKSLGNRVLKES